MGLSSRLGLLENTGKLIGSTDKHVHVFRPCTAIIRFIWTVLAICHMYACGGSRKYRAMFENRVHFDKADRFIRNLESSSKLIIADVFPEPHRSLFNEGYGVVDLVHNMFSRKNWAYRQGSGYWKIPVNLLKMSTKTIRTWNAVYVHSLAT